ncbi:MAG: hypothetical protein ACUVT3_02940 [Ignavibacterium sp.]
MWYLDTTRIFVQKYETTNNQIVARLQPLSGLSVHQIFGAESEVINIECLVVGNTDRNTLKAKVRDGATHTLTGAFGINITGLIVKSMKDSLTNAICQTLRPDLPETAPVYSVSLELYRDE